jgi:hypothetical protein
MKAELLKNHKEPLTSFIKEEAMTIISSNLTDVEFLSCIEILDKVIEFFNQTERSKSFKNLYYSNNKINIINLSVLPIQAMHYYIMTGRETDLMELPAVCDSPLKELDYAHYLNYQIAYYELHSDRREQFLKAWRTDYKARYVYCPQNVLRGFERTLNREPSISEMEDFTKL